MSSYILSLLIIIETKLGYYSILCRRLFYAGPQARPREQSVHGPNQVPIVHVSQRVGRIWVVAYNGIISKTHPFVNCFFTVWHLFSSHSSLYSLFIPSQSILLPQSGHGRQDIFSTTPSTLIFIILAILMAFVTINLTKSCGEVTIIIPSIGID